MEVHALPIPYALKIVIRKFQENYPNYPDLIIGQYFFDLYSYCSHVERSDYDKGTSLEYLYRMAQIFLIELNLDCDEHFCYYFMEKYQVETHEELEETDGFQEATDAANLLISLLTDFAIRDIYYGEQLWGSPSVEDGIDYVVLEELVLIRNLAVITVYMESESTTYQY